MFTIFHYCLSTIFLFFHYFISLCSFYYVDICFSFALSPFHSLSLYFSGWILRSTARQLTHFSFSVILEGVDCRCFDFVCSEFKQFPLCSCIDLNINRQHIIWFHYFLYMWILTFWMIESITLSGIHTIHIGYIFTQQFSPQTINIFIQWSLVGRKNIHFPLLLCSSSSFCLLFFFFFFVLFNQIRIHFSSIILHLLLFPIHITHIKKQCIWSR